ncbi:MAG: DUF2130 domain-containing protein [Bacteroidales bacterium]|nr:DUF2130 domain-containing protein [Bacteroidales bacterium]
MEKETTKIICPNCGAELDVNRILYHQLEDDLRKKFNSQLNEERKKFENQLEALDKEKLLLDDERKAMNSRIAESVALRLKQEKELLEANLRKTIADEESEKFELLQKELGEKSEKLKEFNKAKAEIEILRREKDEIKEALEAQMQRSLNEKLQEERERIRKAEQEKNELVIRELQKKLEDQKNLTEEMKRKQEQGSMQLQGEVQELAIEEWLATNFPLDTISEIKKGALGADCIQIVNTHSRVNCGSIYYESKRAKNFSPEWIEKFKSDMRAKGINVGILVTQAYPKGMDRMGLVDGVWVCSFEEFKGLSAVIRESVIRISEVTASQENKGDKMVMLYDFLTSPEFKSQIEAIVEGFTAMKADLESEKRAMMKIWSAREKQIDKVITNTTSMYGSIKGIGGMAIGTIRSLELGDGKEDG